jgi:hypothetical protein
VKLQGSEEFYPWGKRPTRASAADQGVRPTTISLLVSEAGEAI